MTDPVVVRVRDCACPNTPHEDGDVVYLRPHLNLDGGIAAEQDLLAASGDGPLLTRLWLRTFLTHGVTGWNLTDDDGAPLPLDLAAITDDYRIARPVANRASELYAETVMAPFLEAQAARSPTGSMEATTSRRPRRIPSPSE